MFRDAEISPPTFTVLSNFKSSHKNARDFLPPGSPFLCFFCCSGFSDWLLFSINIHFTFNVLEQLGCFFVVVVVFFFFLPFPSCLPFASFSWHKDFHCWPSSSHAQVFLTDSWLLSLPTSWLHQALYLLSASTTRPHPASPCC